MGVAGSRASIDTRRRAEHYAGRQRHPVTFDGFEGQSQLLDGFCPASLLNSDFREARMLRRCRAVVFLLASFASMPTVALAQGTGESAWGIGVSFTPTWKSVESLRKIYIEGEGELEGREFTIGIVRGSTQGGTGVSRSCTSRSRTA